MFNYSSNYKFKYMQPCLLNLEGADLLCNFAQTASHEKISIPARGIIVICLSILLKKILSLIASIYKNGLSCENSRYLNK
jgi:hypothetical protein